MAKYGREPDQLKITPGLSVVVAKTEQEARDKFESLQSLVDFTRGLLQFGIDASQLDLDGPLPENLPEPENGKGRMKQLVELARRENLTVRQLVLRFGVARGHLQLIGSPTRVADVIEEWFTEGGADGFNVVPPLLPGGFEDFVELVVPELQRRGLFHRDYQGATYRENLGLLRPQDARHQAAPAGARRPEEGARGGRRLAGRSELTSPPALDQSDGQQACGQQRPPRPCACAADGAAGLVVQEERGDGGRRGVVWCPAARSIDGPVVSDGGVVVRGPDVCSTV